MVTQRAFLMLRRMLQTPAMRTPARALAVVALIGGLSPVPSVAQEPVRGDNSGKEIVATLATGRVVFCVAHDAIIVASVESGGAPGSLPPAVIPVRSDRIAVLLGAVSWITPDSGAKAVRLDAELSDIAVNSTRHASNSNPDEPTDIEDIGIGLLDQLRTEVTQIHYKLDLAPDEPIVELLLADYEPDYGPEIWSLQYRVHQEDLGNGYWVTSPLRPAYYQLYPPEKSHPGILVEARYPMKSATVAERTLAERLAQHDPQLEPIRASQDFSQVTAAIVAAKSKDAAPASAADFLRTALPVVVGTGSGLVLAKLDVEKGFQWLLPPQGPLPAPSQTKDAPPGAPSLRKYIPPDKR